MKKVKIKTSINIEGMNELEVLLSKQQELLEELRKNNDQIERVRIEINLSMEKATS